MPVCSTFDPLCPLCRPGIVVLKFGSNGTITPTLLPDTHPAMVEVNRIFDASSRAVQEAHFETSCRGNMNPHYVQLAQQLTAQIRAAIADIPLTE